MPFCDPMCKTMDQVKAEVLLNRIAIFNGDKRAIANSLGISLKTVYNWIKLYKLEGVCQAHTHS